MADKNLFSQNVYDNATLFLHEGGKELALNTEPWNQFAQINVINDAGISEINIDDIAGEIEVYTLNGTFISNQIDNLPNGVYIIVNGNKIVKLKK